MNAKVAILAKIYLEAFMAETAQEKFIREQKEATERANAEADRIRAEKAAADADRERIRDNQGPREGGEGGGKDE
jgi:hypothetical protein